MIQRVFGGQEKAYSVQEEQERRLAMNLGVTFGARGREDDQGLEGGMRHTERQGFVGRLRRHPG